MSTNIISVKGKKVILQIRNNNSVYFADTVIYFPIVLKYTGPIQQMQCKGVMLLNVRERILTIRLMDKFAQNPEYAAVLGVECVQDMDGLGDPEDPP